MTGRYGGTEARRHEGSHRPEQLAAAVQRAVQTVLGRGLADPRVRGLVSVTKVLLTDDLEQARVYVSVMPAELGRLTVHGLTHAAPRIRRDIAAAIRARKVPRLLFQLDESIKDQGRIDAAPEELR